MPHFLRPVQILSPEARLGSRQPGELFFPDGFVLPPGEPFTATIVEAAIVWNEWVPRDQGGGFVGQHANPIKTDNELVETCLLTVDTEHGRAVISFVTQQLETIKFALTARPSMFGISLRFQLYKFSDRDAQGNLLGSAWLWKVPVRVGDKT